MENVIVLAHDEAVRMDGQAISALTAQLGEAGAEGVINKAMEEVANRLSLIERCYYKQENDVLWKSAKGLISIAEQIGLMELAVSAQAVADCAQHDDKVALAAVVNRLVRMGDRSLTAVWDISDISNY
ncbi:MAG: hypothetical protein MK180_05780 [Rhodobacteraceae bacterium]|nr:hypothetical protein [Paracoccaceae bacterium]